jgi:predicted TIM-barrel fold metal-dependent hydrolase
MLDRLNDTPLSYFRRFFLDTALALNPPAFAATLALTAHDRLVFGTDWPYLPDETLEFDASALGVTGDEIAAIERSNAAKLVPRLVG